MSKYEKHIISRIFGILFTMLWYIASEVRNKPVDNSKWNDVWGEFRKIIDELEK